MNDGMLVQINRQRKLIPEELLTEALAIQEKERSEGRSPRPLLDILATRGVVDSTTVRLFRTLMHRGVATPARPSGNGEEVTIVDGFHAVVESVVMPAPEPSAATSKAGWPKEVLDAEGDLKNLFGQFVLVAQVGSGGSGTVYRAWDRRVSRYSGLKILHTMEPSALERFTREARIAGNLQHPCIATIYEVGEQEGRYYIAMKYIDGKPIDADPRSIPECLALIRDACRALEYAHSQGIVHRDIKPANLLVDQQDRVYVTDFGIAKQSTHDQTSTLSMTGTIIGTPKYLPPEQARGEAKRADARSDVYSIGATLYTLLAGRAPFPSSNIWETLESVMKREPPALTSLNGAISPELERIIAKAMAKDPAHRFASAGELADELDRILQQRRYTGRYGLLRYLARKWTFLAAAGVVIGVALHLNAGKFYPVPEVPEIKYPDRYRTAADKLLDIWTTYEDFKPDKDMTAEQVRTYQVKMVIDPITKYLEKSPEDILSQGLQARADFLIGKTEAVTALEPKSAKDYRIAFLVGLSRLETYLTTNGVPLPVTEGPSHAEWIAAIPKFPKGLSADSFSVPATPPGLMESEAKEDRLSGEGLQLFMKGTEWTDARLKLGEYCKSRKPLPVFRKALHRATYLSRMWIDTLNQGKELWHGARPCGECLGAGIAVAIGKDNPIAELEALRAQCKAGSYAELYILACIARRSVERGLDPGSAAAAAEKLSPKDASELQGVIRVANLRWKAYSGGDSEAEYLRAQIELSTNPETWMGRLARVEALISLAGRLRLHDSDFDAPLKEAQKLAEELAGLDPGGEWKAPRVLRAEALLRRGDFIGAHKEMPSPSLVSVAANLRASLVRAEISLRLNQLQEAKDFALLAINGCQDHPKAHYLWGAALVREALAKAEGDSGFAAAQTKEAVNLLSIALGRAPDYTLAQFERARALFLLADYAPMSNSHAAQCRVAAYADIKRVLEKLPNLAPAQAIRDHLWELLNKDGAVKGLSK